MQVVEDILFNEAEHRYYDREGRNYTSVTTLIGKYTDTFDIPFWAMYTALKNHGYNLKPDTKTNCIKVAGVNNKLKDLYRDPLFTAWADEVKAKWVAINLEACMRGNATHDALENGINQSKNDYQGETNSYILPHLTKRTIETLHDLDKTNFKTEYPIVYDRLSGYIDRGFSIFAEKRVYLKDFLIAGMIDVPLMYKDGKHFSILDWKTNKDELHKTTGYYKKRKIGDTWVKTTEWIETDDRFKYPLDMLQCSKFNIYALQLSLYAYILEQWGYILLPKGLEIIHFSLLNEPEVIKVPYLKHEVEVMLNHHKLTICQ